MSLSSEMTRYINTGHCPYCDVVILDADYLRRYSDLLESYAQASASFSVGYREMRYLVASAKAELVGMQNIRCLTCNKTWQIPSVLLPGRPVAHQLSEVSWPDRLRPYYGESERQQMPSPFPKGMSDVSAPKPSLPVRVDLSGCRMTGRKDERQIEEFLSTERKKYQNNSAVATLTKEVSVSNSITRTVTIESNKIRTHNTQAGVTIFGFAEVQAEVQKQLSETYAVATEDSLTISEKSTIAIPPAAIVEHVIQWKLISWSGIAILGRSGSQSSSSLAEVPYKVPHRLTYSDALNDVRRSKK